LGLVVDEVDNSCFYSRMKKNALRKPVHYGVKVCAV